jgi:hypothetical protein
MFNTIREYFETRRQIATAMRGYTKMSDSVEKLLRVAEAWLRTPSTKPVSTVAFDLFTASLLRGVAAGSADVASYLSKKAERARDEEASFTETQHVGVELARIVGDALMREGQGYEIVISNPAVALKAAAVIREQLLQDTEIVAREDGQSLLRVTAGAASSNYDKPQGSRVAEIIGIIHMSQGKLCSFLVEDDTATSIAVKIREHFPQRQVVIEGGGAGKAHVIVRAVDEESGGESVH